MQTQSRRISICHGMFIIVGALICAWATPGSGQTELENEVYQTGLGYVDGFYTGDSKLLAKVLSPSLNKYGFWKDESSDEFQAAGNMSYDEALQYADNVQANKDFPAEDAPKKVEVIDFNDKIALIKVSAWWGIDYMLLSQNEGHWTIGQIIWEGPTLESSATDEDRKKVEQAGLNYIEGVYEGDSAKLAVSVKPTLYKYGYGLDRNSGEYFPGKQMTFEQAIAYCDRIKAENKFADADAPKKVEVLDVMNHTAALKVTAWWGVDYMLLVRNGDDWLIEQILWAGQ